MHLTVVGTGYVGLVTGVCLAEIGHTVLCVDIDENRIKLLNSGKSPIFEVGIEKLILNNKEHERLFFSTQYEESLSETEILFIAVGTPQKTDGSADLDQVFALAENIGKTLDHSILIIVKSTVPIGTCEKVETIINENLLKRNKDFKVTVASNPEFLKEGTAVSDFMKPDRIIVGVDSKSVLSSIQRLYRPFILDDPNKLLIVSRNASEMIKYASNAMLATRISFVNELSRLCDSLEVNIDEVRYGMGLDSRIGKKFLYAGPGYGGSCFPKDVSAIVDMGDKNNCSMSVLRAVQMVNQEQIYYVSKKVKHYFKDLNGIVLGVWGLAFKPGTDDVREAPSKSFIQFVLNEGAKVVAHDPQAIESFRKDFGEHPSISYVKDAYDVLHGADALVLLTEWSEYRWPNWERFKSLMKRKVIFDFRNQYDHVQVIEHNFHYQCIGRPDSTHIKQGAV